MINLIRHKPDLSDVVMPLVRFLASGSLSWAERAEIADAIRACEHQWRGMEEEAAHLNQQNCGAQQQKVQAVAEKLAAEAPGKLERVPKFGDLDYEPPEHELKRGIRSGSSRTSASEPK